MKKQKCRQEIVIVIALIALCVYVFVTAGGFKGDSGMLPRITAVITGALCVMQLGVSMREYKALQGVEDAPPVPAKYFIMASVALVVYTALIFIVGYYIATAIYLCGSIYLFGYRKKVIILAITAGLVAFIYVLFNVLMYVKMPTGLFGLMF